MTHEQPLVSFLRTSLLLTLALAGPSGCASDQTSLLVTVTFDDAAQHPTALTVSVAMLRRSISTSIAAPGNRALKSGDSFAVLLLDEDDGQEVSVDVATKGGAVLSGRGVGTVRKHVEVPVTIALGVPAVDAGADLAMPDAAMPDLAMPDLATPDFAMPDFAMPDLVPACAPSCANGTELTCTDGGMTSRLCPFGCGGSGRCVRPDSCASPADISAGGTFNDSLTGYADDDKGSCGGAGGVDAVTQLTTNDWRTAVISTAGSSFDTLLYARLACADGTTELPLAGPCLQSMLSYAGTACNDDWNGLTTSQLVLCNLPPGFPIYTWLDSKGLGGAYTLDVKLSAPASLNTCAEAGNLLDGKNRTFSVDTSKKTRAFSASGMTCGADNGASAPDAIFFLAVTQQRMVTLTTTAAFQNLVYFRPSCGGKDTACAASQSMNGNQVATVSAMLAPGFYFVIVDGVGGASGPITLNVK